jgi:hypothetical protein
VTVGTLWARAAAIFRRVAASLAICQHAIEIFRGSHEMGALVEMTFERDRVVAWIEGARQRRQFWYADQPQIFPCTEPTVSISHRETSISGYTDFMTLETRPSAPVDCTRDLDADFLAKTR